MKSQLIHLPINNAAKHTRHIEKHGTLEIRQSFCTPNYTRTYMFACLWYVIHVTKNQCDTADQKTVQMIQRTVQC